MPIDIALTGLAMPLAEFPALAREAEDRGYRTAWVGRPPAPRRSCCRR